MRRANIYFVSLANEVYASVKNEITVDSVCETPRMLPVHYPIRMETFQALQIPTQRTPHLAYLPTRLDDAS